MLNNKVTSKQFKYKEILYEEFTDNKPVVFEPPVEAIVWNTEEDIKLERTVYYYDPRLPKHQHVIGVTNDGYANEYRHMALIPTTKENKILSRFI